MIKLRTATEADLTTLKSWFQDQNTARRWGGPDLRFPFRDEEFKQDIHWRQMATYVLTDQTHMIGFGQCYERNNRHHLGRLVVAPHHRGQGLGQQLIKLILRAVQLQQHRRESSLFVYRDNQPALHCYEQLGYQPTPYPEDVRRFGDVIFMVKTLQ